MPLMLERNTSRSDIAMYYTGTFVICHALPSSRQETSAIVKVVDCSDESVYLRVADSVDGTVLIGQGEELIVDYEEFLETCDPLFPAPTYTNMYKHHAATYLDMVPARSVKKSLSKQWLTSNFPNRTDMLLLLRSALSRQAYDDFIHDSATPLGALLAPALSALPQALEDLRSGTMFSSALTTNFALSQRLTGKGLLIYCRLQDIGRVEAGSNGQHTLRFRHPEYTSLFFRDVLESNPNNPSTEVQVDGITETVISLRVA